jgi:hypothetical protein
LFVVVNAIRFSIVVPFIVTSAVTLFALFFTVFRHAVPTRFNADYDPILRLLDFGK